MNKLSNQDQLWEKTIWILYSPVAPVATAVSFSSLTTLLAHGYPKAEATSVEAEGGR